MKKIFVLVLSLALLQACSDSNNASPAPATENDGMKTGDTNGGLADTARTTDQSATDTSKGEHREDLSSRDTFDKKPPH